MRSPHVIQGVHEVVPEDGQEAEEQKLREHVVLHNRFCQKWFFLEKWEKGFYLVFYVERDDEDDEDEDVVHGGLRVSKTSRQEALKVFKIGKRRKIFFYLIILWIPIR